MATKLRVLRINPVTRVIAPMLIDVGHNAVPLIKRLVRAKEIGWREVMPIGPDILVVAGGLEMPEETPGWRLVGGEDTSGIGLLFGRGLGGAMWHVPVDKAWAESRIRWLDGEDVRGTRARAEETLPLLADELRSAIAAAVPSLSDGALWLTQDDKAAWEACLALGLTTPSTGGQRLSPLGSAVHDLIAAS
jgi:hypothetical protein